VRRDQDYFNRLVRNEGGNVWVRLRPRGSEFRDLTKGIEIVHWFSVLPGLISILGWVLHHTVFRSRWVVSVAPDDPASAAPSVQLEPLRKRKAERLFLRLIDWVQDGHAPDDFQERDETRLSDRPGPTC